MSTLSFICSDIKRYRNDVSHRFEWYEISLYVIVLYRIGHRIRDIRFAPLRWLCALLHTPIFIFLSIFSGINIPRGATIGSGLRIYHYSGIILNPNTLMGNNCTLRPGVVIGNRQNLDAPVIGDNVDFGAGCKVLGNIRIGNNVSIGANAVVLTNVPDNCIAVGVPARIIDKKS